MENEKIKIKIEIDFTYNSTALETIEKIVEEENENISVEDFLNQAIENLMYDRFECDYECIDGEEMEINWTIEKS